MKQQRWPRGCVCMRNPVLYNRVSQRQIALNDNAEGAALCSDSRLTRVEMDADFRESSGAPEEGRSQLFVLPGC